MFKDEYGAPTDATMLYQLKQNLDADICPKGLFTKRILIKSYILDSNGVWYI